MYPRYIERQLKEALSDTRVALISGPRQSGKTTLAQKLAHDEMPFLTLDDETTLEFARSDPVGFVRGIDRAVIDEVQRAPRVLLAIKRSVDTDKRAGRFLLTGSADLMTLPQVADSLAGRMAIAELFPLSQCELRSARSHFLERVFQGKSPPLGERVLGPELVDLVLKGGYPEALERTSWARRQKWFLDYMKAIIERDVRQIAKVDHLRQMPRLIRMLAQHSAQLVNYSSLGAPLGMNHVTTQRYTEIFEKLYIVRTLQPWYTNELKRLVKTPKLHFLDSGLLAALRSLSPERVLSDRKPFGAMLETFVLAELLKLATWSQEHFEFYHFRDRYENEVDIVIENHEGQLVGVEVKAGATVVTNDFSGLRKLADASGKRFALGMVLYDHDTVVPFGDRLFAVPLSTLWGP
jgi:predicted AAA+ superfamily ATPase